MKHGCKPGLDVHDAVRVHVLDHFVRNPLERFLRLHHAAGVSEPFKVEGEASPSGSPVEPGRKFLHILSREIVVSRVPGKLDNRGRAKSAVKVVVEEDFGD